MILKRFSADMVLQHNILTIVDNTVHSVSQQFCKPSVFPDGLKSERYLKKSRVTIQVSSMIYIFVVCMQITVFRDMVLQLILFIKREVCNTCIHLYYFLSFIAFII